jgi:hypothetical protein
VSRTHRQARHGRVAVVMAAAMQIRLGDSSDVLVAERTISERDLLRECRRVGKLLANKGADYRAMADLLRRCQEYETACVAVDEVTKENGR